MPTIDQLDAAVVATDDDVLPISQGGRARRISRSQLLGGMQSALALAPGLLGRASAGYGPPERIRVGGGLKLADGILSGSTPYTIASLPTTTSSRNNDLVAIGQGGQDRSVPLSVLLGTAGIDISNQVVRTSAGIPRRIGEWTSDTLAVEAFGAVGDGLTDDSAAFSRALASGRPIRLGPKTYRVDGQWSVSLSSVLLGTPGVSVLRRRVQHGGAWITVSAPRFAAFGVTFDAGGIAGDSWGVLVEQTCTETSFERCAFINATGQKLGCGLTIQARDGLGRLPSRHTIIQCIFSENKVHGLWVQAACGAYISGCSAFLNGTYGICVDFNDPQSSQIVSNCTITDCRVWSNQRGISVGNYNETNAEPPRWGNNRPDARDVLVCHNVCSGNASYGISVSGERIVVSDNIILVGDQISSASGLLCSASKSLVSGNSICGPGQFGVDAGGCVDCSIIGNIVENCSVGINAGGGQNVRVASNRLYANTRSITAFQVETDGSNGNFGISCKRLDIDSNTIKIESVGSIGICLVDGPENVRITNNRFLALDEIDPIQAISASTDSVFISGNQWNDKTATICIPIEQDDIACLHFADVFDEIVINTRSLQIGRIQSKRQIAIADKITFIRVTNGGDGYQNAGVSIIGSGAGATAVPYLRDGVVIGIALLTGGNGYSCKDTQVIVTGDGAGATAHAFVGLPLTQGKRLRVKCNLPVCFKREGSDPFQDNFTGSDITAATGSQVEWEVIKGGWRANSFSNVDYVVPSGDGRVSLRSQLGDVALRPGEGGAVRFCSEIEQSGFITCFGRGSPEGQIAAPPGSDYRNLEGGIGTTLWLKQLGDDPFGWAAIG